MKDPTKLNDKELGELREKLEEMLAEINSDTKGLLDRLKESANNEMSDPTDRAKEESERIISLRLSQREEFLRGKIMEAMERLQNNTINECSECGDPIGLPRLLVRPVTDLCLSCKERQEQNERSHQI